MLLSIVILSYNRPAQLERILAAFKGVDAMGIEVVVKDDCSPRLVEIVEIVGRYSELLNVPTHIIVNEINLGYDGNLLDSFGRVSGEYVFLLSDDDYLNASSIDSVLTELRHRQYDVYFTPYTCDAGVCRCVTARNGIDIRRDAVTVIYNSILFSGLVIRRVAALGLKVDHEFLVGSIYSQVYLCAALVFRSGGYGALPRGILVLGGDGENFFGGNAASFGQEDLRDRSHISSNLRYQRFLWRVVERLSSDYDERILRLFRSEYRVRLIAHGLRARSLGPRKYLTFLRGYLGLSVGRSVVLDALFCILIFLPARFCFRFYQAGRRALRKSG